jgi:type 2A phosphatase activator TIP41
MSTNGVPSLSSPPTQTHYPTPTSPSANTSTISRHNFKITTRKLPILKAGPIEAMTTELGIAPPEMIFGDNFVSIEHQPTGWGIGFNALDALKGVDKTGKEMLKVAYSGEWARSRYVHYTRSFLLIQSNTVANIF